ncbi:hypothetical protein AB4Z54_06190, partial [Streptomyces sp. MCAF7]
ITFTSDGPGATEPDDWRDLAVRLSAEPELGRIEELRTPVPEDGLGGAGLYGLIAEVGAAGVLALGAVLQSWIRLRAGRFKVSWERDSANGRTVITVDGTNIRGFQAARTIVEDITRAIERTQGTHGTQPPEVTGTAGTSDDAPSSPPRA